MKKKILSGRLFDLFLLKLNRFSFFISNSLIGFVLLKMRERMLEVSDLLGEAHGAAELQAVLLEALSPLRRERKQQRQRQSQRDRGAQLETGHQVVQHGEA